MFTRNGQTVGSIQVDPTVSNPAEREAAKRQAELEAVEPKTEVVDESAAVEPEHEDDPAADAVESTPEPVVQTPKPAAKPADKVVFGSALSKG